MNKNTEEIKQLSESIKNDEERLELYWNNYADVEAEIDTKENEILNIDLRELMPVNNYIYEYNQFKKFIHKPDIINYIYACFFILFAVPVILEGNLAVFPLKYILAGISVGGINVIDFLIRHKINSVNSPLYFKGKKFNKKDYEEAKQEQQEFLEIKERLLKDIEVLREDHQLYGRLTSSLEEKIKSNKELLNKIVEEQETRNQTIRTFLIEKISKMFKALPEYQEIFIEQLRNKGYDVEGVPFEEILTGENLALKLQK